VCEREREGKKTEGGERQREREKERKDMPLRTKL